MSVRFYLFRIHRGCGAILIDKTTCFIKVRSLFKITIIIFYLVTSSLKNDIQKGHKLQIIKVRNIICFRPAKQCHVFLGEGAGGGAYDNNVAKQLFCICLVVYCFKVLVIIDIIV